MVMKTYKFLCLAIVSLMFMGCSESASEETLSQNENIELSDIQFDEAYKNFSVGVHFKETYMPKQRLQPNKIEIEVTEYDINMNKISESAQPIFLGAHNLRSEKIKSLGIKGLVLVDLTLDELQVEKQKLAVESLREFVFHDQLYVAFMKDGNVSQTYPLTDYVIDNYFVADESEKMLFRNIVTKLEEVQSDSSKYFSGIDNSNKVLIAFSDGHLYNGDKPIDPKHFEYQEILLHKCKQADKIQFCYVNLNEEKDDEFAKENEVENIFTYICKQSGGEYLPEIDMKAISEEVLMGRGNNKVDVRLNLSNPDKKIYRGDERILNVKCLYDGEEIFNGSTVYILGSVYKPVIVNGAGISDILIQAGVFTFILLMFIYITFQFIIPFIRYRIFCYKYVTKYTGPNMSFNGIQVPEVCYYCKTPFEIGDEIVVKCEHVMHKSCWDENMYKCPEYGRRCDKGKHYYNHKNLFYRRNSPYYLKWLIAGTLAGLVAWLFFTVGIFHSNLSVIHGVYNTVSQVDPLRDLVFSLHNNKTVSVFAAPYFGFFMCFFLTFALSLLSSHGKWWWKRSTIVLVKSILAGICGYLTYLLVVLALLAFNLKSYYYMIDWIPWALNGYVIAFAVSFKTDIKLKKALLGATISMVFSIASMYLWNYSSSSHIDSRDLLLVSCLIYSIGLAVSLAINYPHSERYFLKVEGPIKTMEIALYKWMNAQLIERTVSIGKSVDCNLQMSWDINSAIAPKQALLKLIGGNIYLIPQEQGVTFKGKPAIIDKRLHLYHGDKFVIGQTTFTYVEHDV